MNELVAYQSSNLPASADDLAKFLIIAQEKVKAVKAEIQAIRKLNLAKEVYDQKMGEQRQLQEVILLAYQRMGEITREMQTSPGQRTDCKPIRTNANGSEKTKKQATRELGLSKDQVSRMEQIAAHPDIVEDVLIESQAGQTEATQGEVLRRIKERKNVIDMAQARKKTFDRDMSQIDEDYEIIKEFHTAIHSPLKLPVSNADVVAALMRATHSLSDLFSGDLDTLGEAVQKLQEIQALLRKEAYKHGKKRDHQ